MKEKIEQTEEPVVGANEDCREVGTRILEILDKLHQLLSSLNARIPAEAKLSPPDVRSVSEELRQEPEVKKIPPKPSSDWLTYYLSYRHPRSRHEIMHELRAAAYLDRPPRRSTHPDDVGRIYNRSIDGSGVVAPHGWLYREPGDNR